MEEWRAAGGDEGNKERGGDSISTQPSAVQAAADARLLLRRLAKQARTLRIPHLMAYGELARARHKSKLALEIAESAPASRVFRL